VVESTFILWIIYYLFPTVEKISKSVNSWWSYCKS